MTCLEVLLYWILATFGLSGSLDGSPPPGLGEAITCSCMISGESSDDDGGPTSGGGTAVVGGRPSTHIYNGF